jgi:hypothetical protein
LTALLRRIALQINAGALSRSRLVQCDRCKSGRLRHLHRLRAPRFPPEEHRELASRQAGTLAGYDRPRIIGSKVASSGRETMSADSLRVQKIPRQRPTVRRASCLGMSPTASTKPHFAGLSCPDRPNNVSGQIALTALEGLRSDSPPRWPLQADPAVGPWAAPQSCRSSIARPVRPRQFGTLAPNLWAMSIASTIALRALLHYLNATSLLTMN